MGRTPSEKNGSDGREPAADRSYSAPNLSLFGASKYSIMKLSGRCYRLKKKRIGLPGCFCPAGSSVK